MERYVTMHEGALLFVWKGGPLCIWLQKAQSNWQIKFKTEYR